MGGVGQETKLSVGDISQLLDVVTEIAERGQCTPSEAVQRIANILSPDASPEQRERATLAERHRQLRLRRNEVNRRASRGTCCSSCSPRTKAAAAFRSARSATRRVSLRRQRCASPAPRKTWPDHPRDSFDNRRCYVEPTAKAVAGIASMATMMLEQSQAVDSVGGETAGTSGASYGI